MAKIDKIQTPSGYTIYRHPDLMGDDVIIHPHEARGAEVILVTSFFVDYGHFQCAYDISEEQYITLQNIATWEELDTFVCSLMRDTP